MPATFSTASRRLFRRSRSVLKPHLSLNRNPKAVCDKMIRSVGEVVYLEREKKTVSISPSLCTRLQLSHSRLKIQVDNQDN